MEEACPGPDERRKELVRITEQAADWIVQRNVKPNELCLFRRMVEQLVA